MFTNDRGLEEVISDGSHEEDEAVNCGGYRSDVIFSDPVGGEGKKREPEEEMEIGPENAAADLFDGVEEVMVVVPVDSNVGEAEDVAEEDGEEGS